MFEFSISARDKSSSARKGVFVTPHGHLETPELAIVATDGVVKSLTPDDIPHTPIQYAIANTFHMYVKQIVDNVVKAGGLHSYMNYNRVIATDSGGFQVFSLGFGKAHNVNKLGNIFTGEKGTEGDENNPLTITEDDVTFTFDGKPVRLNPEISIDIQHKLGADIMFAFDECTSSLNTKEYTKTALERTHRWLDRCIEAHTPFKEKQALFAIVQGGYYKDLRTLSGKFLAQKDVPGYGIGGSLGKTKQHMHDILEWTLPLLPDNKPRHLLGIGNVRDIFEGVQRGIDLFDCVIPTREARHRILYTPTGRVQVRISKATDDIIDTRPGSPTLLDKITWRQLSLWFQMHDPRAYKYATLHNIFFFTELMREIREAIASGTFMELKKQYLAYY